MKKPDKIVIEEYPQNYWGVAKVFKNGIEIANINRYYEVTTDWILIYAATGGHDFIHRGELIKKIFIGDCELEVKEVQEKII